MAHVHRAVGAVRPVQTWRITDVFVANKSGEVHMKHAGMEPCINHHRQFRIDPEPLMNPSRGISNVYDLYTDPELFQDMLACADKDNR
ncbi:hypothetical protein [Paraburkholderia sp. RL17-337-BIB-A]|uniref:hypothetical protein n=1 Tax=Paraburkholderia sp. RL17-337-BIB-A TaxID=3031636 RepID=UPI0038BAB708